MEATSRMITVLCLILTTPLTISTPASPYPTTTTRSLSLFNPPAGATDWSDRSARTGWRRQVLWWGHQELPTVSFSPPTAPPTSTSTPTPTSPPTTYTPRWRTTTRLTPASLRSPVRGKMSLCTPTAAAAATGQPTITITNRLVFFSSNSYIISSRYLLTYLNLSLTSGFSFCHSSTNMLLHFSPVTWWQSAECPSLWRWQGCSRTGRYSPSAELSGLSHPRGLGDTGTRGHATHRGTGGQPGRERDTRTNTIRFTCECGGQVSSYYL